MTASPTWHPHRVAGRRHHRLPRQYNGPCRGGQVVENGIPDPTTANVTAIAYGYTETFPINDSYMAGERVAAVVARETSAGWSPAGGTTVSARASFRRTEPSSRQATRRRSSTANGNIWTISNGQVVKNGMVDPTTANVIEMDYKGGYVWQENADQLWWSYSQASDGSTVWTPGTLPITRAWIGGGV